MAHAAKGNFGAKIVLALNGAAGHAAQHGDLSGMGQGIGYRALKELFRSSGDEEYPALNTTENRIAFSHRDAATQAKFQLFIMDVNTGQFAQLTGPGTSAGLGATAYPPNEPETHEGWEDAAVPPDRLGSYFRKLFALMGEYDYTSPLYGHFGDGCVHMRMDFDLETEPGILKFREFIDRAAGLIGRQEF